MTSTATATAPRRRERGPADYIFKPRNSNNWWIKLRANGKRIEHTLGTADRIEAQAVAAPLIAQHRATLLANRPRVEATFQYKLEPGREHVGPDGGKILATEKELFHIGHNGSIIHSEPNGGMVYAVAGQIGDVRSLAAAYITADFGDGPGTRTAAPKRNSDDALFQTYLDHGGKHNAGVHGHFRREAEGVWATFKRLTDNKPLKDCGREDARKLVAHFQADGLSKPTIRKKVMWLSAAINHAIREETFKGANPFTGICPKDTVAEKRERKRLIFSEADLAHCKAHIGELAESDQLLFRLLATTGMRLSEAWHIDGEAKRAGVRYVTIGSKSELSLRDVPFPQVLLPHLPPAVKGKLFDGTSAAASKRLNRFLRSVGKAEENANLCNSKLVLYSLRHTVETRLRDAACPPKFLVGLLGHEEGKAVGDDYGEAVAMPVLKEWIDKVGIVL